VTDHPPAGFDPDIGEYYERAPEETRLDTGPFLLEAVRTCELIERFAPPPPATVLDVGGGAGAYAFWLAGRGYDVHLVDASPRLVGIARRRAAAGGPAPASCEIGDARSLRFGDDSARVVLLLGPLYHLTGDGDRARALAEARRVLAPGGLLFAAAISRFVSLLGALVAGQLPDAQLRAVVERDLDEGQHRNPTGRLDWFTTAYFHTPAGFEAEVRGAGFAPAGLFGLEGAGWLLPDIEARMRDPQARADLLFAARRLEAEPSVLGINAHLLAVARRPA